MRHVWERILKSRGYKLRGTIGEGAYSKVKLAYSHELKKNVAIKCVSFRDAPLDFIAKFLPRELGTLATLRHKNVIRVYDVVEYYTSDLRNCHVCIVMEHAKLGDMLKYIQESGALPEEEIKKYFHQLCQAVKYCQSKGVCHRDLKCENLLLGKDKKLILSDFGFCKYVNRDHNGNVEPSDTYCGSAAYAAPETLQGKPYNPFMHDMWSLGVILYIMASGQMPFDDGNISQMLKAQTQENTNSLISYRCGYSKPLKSLLKSLLQVDVRRRATIDDTLAHPFLSASHGDGVTRKANLSWNTLAVTKKASPFAQIKKLDVAKNKSKVKIKGCSSGETTRAILPVQNRLKKLMRTPRFLRQQREALRCKKMLKTKRLKRAAKKRRSSKESAFSTE